MMYSIRRFLWDRYWAAPWGSRRERFFHAAWRAIS